MSEDGPRGRRSPEEYVHDLLFFVILYCFVGGVWFLVTADFPSPSGVYLATLLVKWTGGHLLRIKREQEVTALKVLHELPATDNEK